MRTDSIAIVTYAYADGGHVNVDAEVLLDRPPPPTRPKRAYLPAPSGHRRQRPAQSCVKAVSSSISTPSRTT
jgi:hypothetical protein